MPVDMNDKDKIIIVFYIDIRDVAHEDIPCYINSVSNHFSNAFDSTIKCIVVPFKNDTKIECINPKLVNEEEYIKIMHDLEMFYQEFINMIKKE